MSANKHNVVLGVAPLQILMVRFADSSGTERVCLVGVGGKDNSDGGPAVLVLAEPEELTNRKMAKPHVQKGVRQWLANQESARGQGSSVPDSLTQVDLGSLGDL